MTTQDRISRWRAARNPQRRVSPPMGESTESAKEILEKLGFNSEADESAKRAFLKSLFMNAGIVEETREKQLSFDLESVG